jgi:hypothetical protein
MINIYNQYCLQDVFSNINSYKYYRSELKKLDEYNNKINTCNCFGTLEYSIKFISCDLFKNDEYQKYTKESLLAIVNNEKKSVEEKLTNSILFNEEKVGKDICDLISTEVSNNKVNKDKWCREEREDFVNKIEEHGEDSIEIWKHQSYYNKKAMQFLVRHPDIFTINTLDKCTDIEMGLLCANGGYCHLTIGEAPQLLSWKISEYDGLESITVQP